MSTLEGLRCRECATEYPLEAQYVCEQCFGPLEVAYDFSGLDPDSTKRKIQAGPPGIWRYSDFLPFERAEAAVADEASLQLVLRPAFLASQCLDRHPNAPFMSKNLRRCVTEAWEASSHISMELAPFPRSYARPAAVAGASQGHVPPPLSMQRLCESRRIAGCASRILKVTPMLDDPLRRHAEPSKAPTQALGSRAG